MGPNLSAEISLPAWLPDAVRLYLDHTEQGVSLRQIARREGCHASTVMRQVRRCENRRDDPLVDEALSALGRVQETVQCNPHQKDTQAMTAQIRNDTIAMDEAKIHGEARRILGRLAEAETVLVIAPDMEKAAVLRVLGNGKTTRLAVIDRMVAQAFALNDWIECTKPGRVATYQISSTGQAAYKRLSGEPAALRGMADSAARFDDQRRAWPTKDHDPDDSDRPTRYTAAESPVLVLARRRDKDGNPFLSPELVAAAERLREDFELAQMGPRITQNWERFLTGQSRGPNGSGETTNLTPQNARERVSAALRDLGPGLGDMVLRCCCFQEGLETAEKRMGWSARSGKIVLRIALQRLRRHYDETYGKFGPLIG